MEVIIWIYNWNFKVYARKHFYILYRNFQYFLIQRRKQSNSVQSYVRVWILFN